MPDNHGIHLHFLPKTSALRFHQSNGSRLSRAPLALWNQSRVLLHRRAPADCFGANPVASVLRNPVGRDPEERPTRRSAFFPSLRDSSPDT